MKKFVLRLNTVEENAHENGYKIDNHSHNYFEAVYYIEGHGKFNINNTEYDFSPNTFSIIRPNCIHNEKSNEKTKLIYVGFSLPNSVDSSFLKNGVYSVDNNDHILGTMYEILTEYNDKEFYFADQIDILLHYLLNLFKRVRAKKDKKPYEMQAIKDYIDKNCYKNLNAKLLAEKFNYNYDYFRRKFEQNYHISINAYILNEQVNYATNLLRTTNLKISEIAKRSGFSSTSHFINCFKKRYNVTPKKYIY